MLSTLHNKLKTIAKPWFYLTCQERIALILVICILLLGAVVRHWLI